MGTRDAALRNVSARAIWKGTLEFGGIQLPVKLHAAVEDRRLHFRLLHAKDRIPVRQRLLDPVTGNEIPTDQVRWGLEIEERMVVLEPSELEAAKPGPSKRTIEVTRFVPRAAIDVAWYRRPYFLSPDGSARDCAALIDALRATDRYGVARWVMRGARHFGALAWQEDHLQLLALHDAAEVVAASELVQTARPAASEKELELAGQLVAMLDAPFDPAELRDEYRERVEKLIAAKRRGRSYRVKEVVPRPSRSELDALLRRSLRAAKTARSHPRAAA